MTTAMLLIQNDISDEFLTDAEVSELTGTRAKRTQIDWLKEKGWQFEINRKGEIKIGRWYSRLKMAGVALHEIAIDTSADQPRFDKVS